MPRSTVKKSVPMHQEPMVWGIVGAYAIGMLMAGLIGFMANPDSVKPDSNMSSAGAPQAYMGPPVVEDSSASGEVVVQPASRNLLRNGSFETPIVRSMSQVVANGAAGLGWRVSWTNAGNPQLLRLTREPGLEILAGYQSWRAAEGAQFARLDTADLGARSASTQSLVTLSQDVQAIAGAHRLAFSFAPQPGTGSLDNQLEVRWNGKVLAKLSADGTKDSLPDWKTYAYTVQVTGKGDLLEVAGVAGKGYENSKGVLVDNFSLVPVAR